MSVVNDHHPDRRGDAINGATGMGRNSLFLCFFAVTLSVASHAIAEETIDLATGEWLPFISEKHKHSGVVAHIVSEAFALEGIKVNYHFAPWKRGLFWVDSGKLDGAAVWAWNPEREKSYHLSDVVLTGSLVFFHRKDFRFDWESVNDLMKSKNTIAGVLGYDYGDDLNSAEKSRKVVINRVDDEETCFRMLLKGRAELFPGNLEAGYELLNRKFGAHERAQITHHTKPIRTSDYHLLLSRNSKRNVRLLELFNNGLRRLKSSGKYDELLADLIKGKYYQEP